MAKKTSSAKPTQQQLETIDSDLIVYGLDPSGKPKAARFRADVRDQAIKAASSLGYQSLEAATPDQIEIARKLPLGRIAARGPAFIPYVKRALYDRIAFVSGTQAPASITTKVPRLPKDWKSIAVGDLVLVYEGPQEGWWECVVLERDADKLLLRSWEFPKIAPFDCSISEIGLIYPDQKEEDLVR